MELTEAMMADLGVTPEYVEIPFGQLFAGLVAGKFDMMGISATILPSRALKGLFASFPVFYESIVVLLRPGSTITNQSQLDGKKIAVLQGSSQEFSSKLLFPKATFSPFAGLADAVNEVAAGRADATVLSEFDVEPTLAAHPNLKLLAGPPLWVDANTYLIHLPDAARRLQAAGLGQQLAALQRDASAPDRQLEEVAGSRPPEVPPDDVRRRSWRRAGRSQGLIPTRRGPAKSPARVSFTRAR